MTGLQSGTPAGERSEAGLLATRMVNPEISLVGRRRLLWRICLAQLPPDERERILAEPAGTEALSFAVTVELFAQDDPAKLHALLADPGNEIRTVCDDEAGAIHEVGKESVSKP